MLKIILIITTQQRQRPPHPSRPASQEALPHAAFISGKHCSSEKGSRATPPPPPPPRPMPDSSAELGLPEWRAASLLFIDYCICYNYVIFKRMCLCPKCRHRNN